MTKFLIPALLLFTGIAAQAQVLVFPHSAATVAADGVLTAAEWQNAQHAKIAVNATDTVAVWYQYNSTSMQFAFAGKLESAAALFPEILFDPQYQQTPAWTAGQWWFHMSATDCEHNGAYGVYSNCQATQPGWQAAPNFATGGPMTDTVEIVIPFTKLGLPSAPADTIGIAFVVTNTATIFRLFPASADRNNPSTWAKAVFQVPATIKNIESGSFSLYPNPSGEVIHLRTLQPCTITISDLRGRLMYKISTDKEELAIPLSGFSTGTYIISFTGRDGARTHTRFIKSTAAQK